MFKDVYVDDQKDSNQCFNVIVVINGFIYNVKIKN